MLSSQLISHKISAYTKDFKKSLGITIIPTIETLVSSSDINPMFFFGFEYLKQSLLERKTRAFWCTLEKCSGRVVQNHSENCVKGHDWLEKATEAR